VANEEKRAVKLAKKNLEKAEKRLEQKEKETADLKVQEIVENNHADKLKTILRPVPANQTTRARAHCKYNYALLVLDIMENLVITQIELGESIGCTQQTISNWLGSVRNPGADRQVQLDKLANHAGLELSNYVREFNHINDLPKDVRELAKRMEKMSLKHRRIYFQALDHIVKEGKS